MQLRPIGLVLACGLASALTAACDTESDTPPPPPEVAANAIAQELSDVVCALSFQCDCSNGRAFQSPTECTAWAEAEEANVTRLMETYDLLWDPTCVGWYVQGFEELQCASRQAFSTDPDGDDCHAPCMPLYGDKLVDEVCLVFENGISNCGRGLRCDGETCVEPCPDPVGLGEACQNAPCGDDLFCDFSGEFEPRCSKQAGEGDDCSQIECGTALRCVIADPLDPTTARCELQAKLSEACMGHGDCDTGYCPAGFCQEIPGEGGDCRGTGICAEGLWCVEDVCGAAKKEGDACTTSCGGGLDCFDGVCLGVNAAACYPDSPITSNG